MKPSLQLHTSSENVPLPRGTRVVLLESLVARSGYLCKPGSLGRIDVVEHPRYVVSTPAGQTLDVLRGQLTVQNQRVEAHITRSADDWQQYQAQVVLKVVVGSRAWGLDNPASDTDIRGVFVLPFEQANGLFETPTDLAAPAGEESYWEVEKAIRQGLRADANTLEMLWSPLVRYASPAGRLLRDRRDIFSSRRVFGSFGRYAIGQFDKIRRRLDHQAVDEALREVLLEWPDADPTTVVDRVVASGTFGDKKAVSAALKRFAGSLFDQGLTQKRSFDAAAAYMADTGVLVPARPYRPKNAYNLLRLLHSGLHWMEHGQPLIEIEAGREDGLREQLLAIKAGELDIERVAADAREVAVRLEEAWRVTSVPDEPDFAAADELLRTVRRHEARAHFGLTAPLTTPVAAARKPRITLERAPLEQYLDRFDHLDMVICAVTGAHHFGFPSEDSDVDLKAIHLLPAATVLGLEKPVTVVDAMEVVEGVEMDFTSNEVGGVIKGILAGNGNMLERVHAPFHVVPGPSATEFAQRRLGELRALTLANLHRGFYRHYRGFFEGKRKDFAASRRIKSLLYAYRIALTGIHLFSTGEVVCDALVLAREYGREGRVGPLIEAKRAGGEGCTIELMPDGFATAIDAHLDQLSVDLENAFTASDLPEVPPQPASLAAWLTAWRTTPAYVIHPVTDAVKAK